jgi:hypothetical protein
MNFNRSTYNGLGNQIEFRRWFQHGFLLPTQTRLAPTG